MCIFRHRIIAWVCFGTFWKHEEHWLLRSSLTRHTRPDSVESGSYEKDLEVKVHMGFAKGRWFKTYPTCDPIDLANCDADSDTNVGLTHVSRMYQLLSRYIEPLGLGQQAQRNQNPRRRRGECTSRSLQTSCHVC